METVGYGGHASDAKRVPWHFERRDLRENDVAGKILYLIIDTAPVKHDLNPFTLPLDIDGSLVIVGQIGLMEETLTIPLVMGRRRAAGSLNEGIAKTQEVLDFCATHNVYPECGMINIEQINDALARPEQGIGHTVSLLIWHRSAQNKCIS